MSVPTVTEVTVRTVRVLLLLISAVRRNPSEAIVERDSFVVSGLPKTYPRFTRSEMPLRAGRVLEPPLAEEPNDASGQRSHGEDSAKSSKWNILLSFLGASVTQRTYRL